MNIALGSRFTPAAQPMPQPQRQQAEQWRTPTQVVGVPPVEGRRIALRPFGRGVRLLPTLPTAAFATPDEFGAIGGKPVPMAESATCEHEKSLTR